MCVYIDVYVHTHTHTHIYIYIDMYELLDSQVKIEGLGAHRWLLVVSPLGEEGEGESNYIYIYIYIDIYIYIYIQTHINK